MPLNFVSFFLAINKKAQSPKCRRKQENKIPSLRSSKIDRDVPVSSLKTNIFEKGLIIVRF